MKKIAILTTFTGYDPAYSLIRVVDDQIRMLVAGGYKPVVVTKPGFTPEEAFALPQVELRTLPNVFTSNYIQEQLNEQFDKDVAKLEEGLVKVLGDCQVVLTHDLIYQPESLKLNVAARSAIKKNKLDKIRWLHWVHSATSPYDLAKELKQGTIYADSVKTKFPNSFVIFPNAYSIPRVARNFGYEETEVKVVPHPINIFSFKGWHPGVIELVVEKEMFKADSICVYPARLDRGKQLEVVIKIMAQMKKADWNVRVIFADFHSTGGDKVSYRKELKDLAKSWGLNDQELTFLSEFNAAWQGSVPKRVIANLFDLADLHIMPSRSETYSLVAQEAASYGNLLILNHDFAPFRDIYGKHAIYRQFSANIGFDGLDGDIETKPDNEEGYYKDIALQAKYYLENEKSIAQKRRIRKERTPMYVFEKFLEPLLHSD
jgi:glycosyltransferase involved in cell wall biosynthesis